MADGSPLKRTIALDFVPAPDTSGIATSGLARAGAGLARLAGEIDYYQTAERTRLDRAAKQARTQASLVSARLAGAKELNDLYASFGKDADPGTAPDRFADGAKAIHDRISATLDDAEAVKQFALYFGDQTEAKRVSLRTESLARETQSAVATLDTSIDTFVQQAAAARNGAERNTALEAIDAGVKGLVSTGMLSATEGEKRIALAKTSLAKLDAKRFVFADPERAVEALQDGAFADLPPLDRQTLIEQGYGELAERARAATTAKLQLRQDADDALDQIKSVVDAGYSVSPDLFSNAQRLIAQAGTPALASRYNSLARASAIVDGLRGANPREAEAAIQALDAKAAKGATGELAEAATAARRFYGTMTETLAKDPLAWASRQGVAPVAPLKLDGSDTAAAWSARVRSAELVAERYGVPASYLTDAETDVLKAQLATGSADDKMRVLGGLTAALGVRAPAVLQTIAKDQPVAAHVAGLIAAGATSQHLNAARDALRGEALLAGPAKEGAADLAPGAAARSSDTAISARRAMGLAPEDSARVLATADAIYAARASRLGLRGSDANPNARRADAEELYAEAINDALGATRGVDGKRYGGLGEYRGVSVVVPSTIAAEDFEDTIRSLSDADLIAGSDFMGSPPMIGGRAFTAKDLRSSYLISIGDGRYAVSIADPSAGPPSIVENAAGRPYTLDLNRVPRFNFSAIGRESVQ